MSRSKLVGRSSGPVFVATLDLDRPMPAIPGVSPDGDREFARARVLVRCHAQPLGELELPLDRAGLTAAEVAETVSSRVGDALRAHLAADGLPFPSSIPLEGLPVASSARCSWRARLEGRDLPSISVVVPTCGPPEKVCGTVASLLAQTYPRAEVIVVDNRPNTSGVRAAVGRRFGRRVRYVAEPLRGSGRARNAGVRRSTGEIVAFADDDVIADPDWLGFIAAAFAGRDDIGCVTGLILPTELQTDAQVWLEEFGGFSKGCDRRLWNDTDQRPDHPLFPFTIGAFGSGANCAFRRSTFFQLEGFDPVLGGGTLAMGGEDIDLITAVVERGGTIAYEPAALVRHAHGREPEWILREVWGYGVGLSATLTKRFLRDRDTRHAMARRAVPGLRHALGTRSAKNAGKSEAYPRRLTMAERAGMLYGPIAYVRSRAAEWAVDSGCHHDVVVDAPAAIVDGLAIGVTVALGVLLAAGVRGPVREALALAFVSFVPGWAILPRRLRLDWSAVGGLSVALSLAMVASMSVVMLWLRLWGPTALFGLLAAMSFARLVPRTARKVRFPRAALRWQ